MEPQKVYTPKLALKSGILICFSFITYFMLMKMFNLIHITELRFLNIFIMTGGLVLTFRQYRFKSKILNINYLDGMFLGVLTSLISVVTYTVFIYFYFLKIDPALLQELKGNTVMTGNSLSATSAAATVIVEGICAGIILSFIILQYYKSGFYKTVQEKRQNGIHV